MAAHGLVQIVQTVELRAHDGAAELGHPEVGAAEQLALKSLGRKAVRTPAGGGIVIATGTGIEPVIVGQKRAALTGGDGLVILEREAATVAEGADELALIRRAAGLGTVLDDAQIMLLRDGHDGIHIARDAAHMDTDDALGCRGDLLFNVGRIDRQRFVDLGDDGDCFGADNGRAGGEEGIAGHDALVAGADAAGRQRRQQRTRAGAGRQTVLRAHLGLEMLLKLADLGLNAFRAVVPEQIFIVQDLHDLFLFRLADLQSARIHRVVRCGLGLRASVDCKLLCHVFSSSCQVDRPRGILSAVRTKLIK